MRKFLIGLCIASVLVANSLALTTSTTLDTPRPCRIGKIYRLITGTIDVTSSDDTAAVTDITKFFTDTLIVMLETSDLVYRFVWDSTYDSIVAYQLYISDSFYKSDATDISSGTQFHGKQDDGSIQWEAIADASDIGSAQFIAIGIR